MDQSVETRAIDTLLQRGVEIIIPPSAPPPRYRFINWLSGAKDKGRTFIIRQSYLGTLYEISRVALTLEYNEKRIAEDAFGESKRLVEKHAKSMTLICAMAILNSKDDIQAQSESLSEYLLWHLTPERLAQLSLTIMQMNNISDFINSIRLMSGARITAPKLSPEDNGG